MTSLENEEDYVPKSKDKYSEAQISKKKKKRKKVIHDDNDDEEEKEKEEETKIERRRRLARESYARNKKKNKERERKKAMKWFSNGADEGEVDDEKEEDGRITKAHVDSEDERDEEFEDGVVDEDEYDMNDGFVVPDGVLQEGEAAPDTNFYRKMDEVNGEEETKRILRRLRREEEK